MDGLRMKYFVLNPGKTDKYGHASRRAMSAYARSINKENPELADDLERWVSGIEMQIGMEKRRRAPGR